MDDSDRLSVLMSELERRLGRQRCELWLGSHVSLEIEEGILLIGCPSQFEMNWLKSRLHDSLITCMRQVWDDEAKVKYKVKASKKQSTKEPENQSEKKLDAESAHFHSQPDDSGLGTEHRKIASDEPPRRVQSKAIRTNLTFATFIVGKSNELACRTAQSVMEQLGHFGLLLLFGPTGVGKSHLLFAMLQKVRSAGARIRAVRLTAEQFTTEFLTALDRRALPGFRQKYRSIDVLLVDDIQFLVGKRATLDELLHTIDTLHDRGRQVVLTCDRSPGDLQKVSLELVSRISGGLAIPIETPEFHTRLDIARQLAARLQVALDEETIALIATQVVGSARQLSGSINRLIATSLIQQRPITADMARTTLAEFVQENTPVVRLADIQHAVCQVFGVEATNLKSPRKTRSVAEPRMLAMWLARKYTRAALGEIGEFFGRRSHSTVISAQKKIEDLVSRGGQLSLADRPCHIEEAIRQVESVLRTA